MLVGFRVVIDGDEVRFPGLDIGASKLRLLAQRGDFIAVVIPGYSTWAGRGADQQYVGSTVMVFKVDKDNRIDEILSEEQPGRYWRAAQQTAIRLAETESIRLAEIER